MDQPELAARLRDVAVGLLTPFDAHDSDEIRFDELAATAQWLSDNGLDLFLSCANISEYHSLTHEERIESVRVASQALDADDTVIAGVGGSTKTAIELAQTHESNGAAGVMIMPPDHAFKHESGVCTYYHRIADAIDIGVVPYIRGMDATPRLLAHVTDHEQVIGVKWAISDIELFSECVTASEDVVWICGMAEPPAPAYFLEGAEGFSAGVTNFEPRLGLELFEALEMGDFARARQLRDLSVPIMNLRAESGQDNIYPAANSVPVVKAGLECAGRYGGSVREPLVGLSDAEKGRVEDAYEELQHQLDEIVSARAVDTELTGDD